MYYSVDALENGTARLVDDAAAVRSCLRQTCRPVRRRGMCWSTGTAYGVPRPRKQSGGKARAALLLQQILERENAPGNGGSE